MKKHTILTAFVAAFSLLALGCSCCCANDNAACDKKNCKDAQCPPNAVQKAVTPDGEVIYVVAVWNANCESMPPGKGCKTAQCWQTSDGKTLCVKPLKKCTNTSENGQKFQTTNGTAMTTETDNNKVINNKEKQHWAAKQLQNCPANGNAAACKAPEHAVLPNGKPGCAKADVKHAAEAKANVPMPLQDTVVEEDYFIATTGN